MDLNYYINRAHDNAVYKGFYNKPRELGTSLMLIVSELGEALESDRKGKNTNTNYLNYLLSIFEDAAFSRLFKENVKDTFEDEIADVFIRLFDLCGGLGIDIETHIKLKMKYNESREKMHGKKY